MVLECEPAVLSDVSSGHLLVKSGRERTSYFGQYCVRIEEGFPVTGNLSVMIVASEFDQDVRRLTADDGFHQGIIV
eukprot:scaffold2336_cov86-Skeletonema_marinoi.AAC.1